MTTDKWQPVDTGEIDDKPSSRAWKSDDDATMVCYLGMKGRVTVAELLDHFAEHYPHVDPLKLGLNYATVKWEEPATPDDVARRKANEAWRAGRQASWERETYERLKAKFEQ